MLRKGIFDFQLERKIRQVDIPGTRDVIIDGPCYRSAELDPTLDSWIWPYMPYKRGERSSDIAGSIRQYP